MASVRERIGKTENADPSPPKATRKRATKKAAPTKKAANSSSPPRGSLSERAHSDKPAKVAAPTIRTPKGNTGLVVTYDGQSKGGRFKYVGSNDDGDTVLLYRATHTGDEVVIGIGA